MPSESAWRKIIETNPKRVVEFYQVGPNRNRWGYTGLDITMSMLAMKEVAWEGGSSWKALVDYGIAEQLCLAAINLEMKFPENLDTTEQQRLAARETMESSYHIPVEILYMGAHHLESPLSSRDQKFILCIKRYWTALTDQMWRDPQRSLLPGPTHVFERAVFAWLLAELMRKEPSFLSIIDSCDDKTVPLISRFWMHTTHAHDAGGAADCFSLAFDPDPRKDNMVYNYRQSHPVPPHVIPAFLQGVPDGSPGRFLDNFLQRPTDLRLEQLCAACSFLITLSQVSRVGSNLDTSFMNTMCRSLPIFTYLFSLLHDPRQLVPSLGDDSVAAVTAILLLTRHLLNLVDGRWAEQTGSLLRVCAKSRLFEGLEGVLRYGKNGTNNLHNVSCILRDIHGIVDNSPAFLPILRPDLPRSRLMYECLDLAFVADPMIHRWWQTAPESHVYHTKTIWFVLSELQSICEVERRCMRRGCTERSSQRCKGCQDVRYCGRACQKKDWPEHRLTCGLRVPILDDDSGMNYTDIFPERFPFRFPKPARSMPL